MPETKDDVTRAAARPRKPFRSGSQSNPWISQVTASMVAFGIAALAYAGIAAWSAPEEPMGAVEVEQLQQRPLEELEAMDEAQLSELLNDLDAAAEANTAPGVVLDTETARVQSVWEAKWYDR